MSKALAVGDEVGEWLLIRRLKSEGGRWQWLAQCKCGTKTFVSEITLRYHKAAGCEKCRAAPARALASATRKANKLPPPKPSERKRELHGMSSEKDFCRWKGMITRCYDPKTISYADYGVAGHNRL